MSLTGMLRTYTKVDIKLKKDLRDKKHIDSYNPAKSSRELNPYWKDGGSGVPQTAEDIRKSREFLKPIGEDDYYSQSSSYNARNTSEKYNSYSSNKSSNWRKESKEKITSHANKSSTAYSDKIKPDSPKPPTKSKDTLYFSDEKMNKLAAKIVKAEILGDMKVVEELKAKLEAAREYRKNNPDPSEADDDDRIILMSTTSSGNSRPLVSNPGDPRSKGGKRKAETHDSSGRIKYFGNDDKYDLAQMVSIK